MKNKQGFTFVELLATIVIIGILSIIAIVAVNSVIKSGKEKEVASSENMMKLAAKQYFADNVSKKPKTIGASKTITLQDLQSNNYIDNIYDSNKKLCSATQSTIKITKISKTEYEYTANLICDNSTASTETAPGVQVTSNIQNQFINTNNMNDVNVSLKVEFTLNALSGTTLKSYYYEVYRNSTVGGTNWKLIKTSENIAFADEVATKKITVSYTNEKNAEYRFVVYGTNSKGGTGKGTVRNLYIDTEKPTCKITIPSPNGSNGWFKTDVTVTFAGNDNLNTSVDGNNYMSGLAGSRLTASTTVGYDDAKTSRTATQGESTDAKWYGYVKDKAGNTNTCNLKETFNATFKVDKTPPRMWWNSGEGPYESNSGIDVSSGCADDQSSLANSGVASQTGSSHIGSPANPNSATHYCTDKAGNSTSTSRNFYVKYYSAHPACGAKTCETPCCGYYSCATSACGARTCTTSACGYLTCQTSACGYSYTGWVYTGSRNSGTGCTPYESELSKHTCGTGTMTKIYYYTRTKYANSCSSSVCGAATCRSSACGYYTCAAAACGAKTCTSSCCGYYSCWHY